MIEKFDMRKIFPRFILNDREGYAVAKALDAGMGAYIEACAEAAAIWGDVDKMPEWRLDEMAWEYNCAYNYFADVEEKREWIRNAREINRSEGTANAIADYLSAYFTRVEVQEGAENDLAPFHFRVVIDGEQSEETNAIVQKAAARLKNARSVMDSISYRSVESRAEGLYSLTALEGIEIQVISKTIA